jgi:hypothetical protein
MMTLPCQGASSSSNSSEGLNTLLVPEIDRAPQDQQFDPQLPSRQLSLLPSTPLTAPSTSIVGLIVKLDRADRCCGGDLATIGSSRGPHHAGLHCVHCGKHRGWLPAAAIPFIAETRQRFGGLNGPIALRTTESASVSEPLVRDRSQTRAPER